MMNFRHSLEIKSYSNLVPEMAKTNWSAKLMHLNIGNHNS